MSSNAIASPVAIRKVSANHLIGNLEGSVGPGKEYTADEVTDWLALAVADIAGLQSALDGKAPSSHTHAMSEVTGLVSSLAGLSSDIAAVYSATVPTSRTVTINGTTYDLSANRSWTVGDVFTNDSRLSDARTPLAHKSSHLIGGSDAFTAAEIRAILGVSTLSGSNTGDQDLSGYVSLAGSYSNPSWITGLAWSKVSGTPTTIAGYGITDGVVTSDARLSDARTPVAHKSSHLVGGSDAFTAAEIRAVLGVSALSGSNTGDQDLSGYLLSSTAASTYVALAGSYSNPSWITGLAWSKISGITGTPDGTKFLRDDGSWQTVSGGGGGITSLNTLTDATQTFQTGTTGTNFGIVSATGVHTFNLPDASATARGLVTTGTQTFAGAKTFSGQVSLPNGSASAPSFRLAAGQTGFYSDGGGYAAISLNGNWCASFGYGGVAHGIICASPNGIGWKTSEAAAPDLVAYRDAANTWSQRNGTNAQTFRLENTFTSATNREYFQQSWVSNELRMGTAVGSAGGTQRSTVIGSWNAAGTWSPILTVPSAADIVAFNLSTSATYPRLNVVSSGSAQGVYLGVWYSSNNVVLIGTQAAAAADGNTTNGAIGNFVGGGGLGVYTNNSTARKWFWDAQGNVTHSPVAATSGIQTGFTYTGANSTGQTASTEASEVVFTLPTKTWATGALTTQRFVRVTQPTIAFASTSTATLAATFAVDGPPTAGTNATLTNAYSIYSDSGWVGVRSSPSTGIGFHGGTGTPSVLASIRNDSGALQVFSGSTAIASFLSGITLPAAQMLRWSDSTGVNSFSTYDLILQRDAAGTLSQRNSTNAQTFRLENTFTSATNREYFQQSWVSNELRMGTAVGSAGGTQRSTVIGSWDTAGAWAGRLTINPNGTGSYAGGNFAFSGATGWTFVTSGANAGLYSTGGKITFGDQSGILQSGASGANYFMDYTGWSGHRFGVSANTAAPTPFLFTDGTFSALTAGAEMTSVNWNLATTKTFAAGAITNQRAFRIQAPTYSCGSAMTVTNAATLSISGAPVAAGSLTMTNRYALWVETGTSQFGGLINTTSQVVLNTGSHAFTDGFHVVNWNGACVGWSSTGTVNSTSTLDTAFKRVSAGLVEINNGTAGAYRDLVLRNLRMSTPTVPATSSDTGSEGQISWDSNYVYVCTATNTWKRAALSTF